MLPESEDRNNVRVMQARCGFRFSVESIQVGLLGKRLPGEDLHGDATTESLLFRLKDHSHATSAELAYDAEITQLIGLDQL